MKCPFCGFMEDKVVDSRPSRDGTSIRRRRECQECDRRFTSYEQIEELHYMVIKKDGRRERFDRGKLMRGLNKAFEKRPVKQTDIEQLVDDVERMLYASSDREMSTAQIGEYVIEKIKKLDEIAYVRFASVYRKFKDFQQFYEEIHEIIRSKP